MASTTYNIKMSENEQLIIRYEKTFKSNGETSIRRYVQSKLLGRGGFAKVYQFTCLETQEVYAAKEIPKASLKEDVYMQKLKAEIKLHKSLDHPNIVRFERYFEDQENVYILLELCTNESLGQLLKRRTRLTELEVQCYVSQVIQALRYIHEEKILHRDLKLANLLLNDKMQLKVADFGLAAKLSSDTEKRKTVCGTPNFIAPEVLNNIKGYSYPADIWSLGVICYNLLVGKLPFEAKSSKEIYQKIQEGKFTFPSSIQLSVAAKDLITRMLIVNPDKRITIPHILAHPFLNPKEGIPPLMPIATLKVPPTSLVMKQSSEKKVESGTQEPGQKILSNLFQKVESNRENKVLGLATGKKITVQMKSPEKKNQNKTQEIRSPTPTKQKNLNKSEESLGNATSETKSSINKENTTKSSKSTSKQDGGFRGLKEILNEVRDPNAEGGGAVVRTQGDSNENKVKLFDIVNASHRRASMMHVRTISSILNKTGEEHRKENIENIEEKPVIKVQPVPFVEQKAKLKYTYKREDSRRTPNELATEPEEKDKDKEKEKEEKVNIVKAFPINRILYWLDYTASYGLGYTLSDGSVGALFNDETKMVLNPQEETFDYVTVEIGRKEVHKNYSIHQYPETLKEKVMDLQRFNNYFERHRQKTTKETGQSQSSGLLYVKKWFKTKHAHLFRMNTEELQVVFIDQSVLAMNADGKKIKYITKKGEMRSYNLETESLSKDIEVKKRLNYTMEVLEKLWNKVNEDNAKRKGEKAEMNIKG